MDPRAIKWLGKVITVHGPIPADELGVTLPARAHPDPPPGAARRMR